MREAGILLPVFSLPSSGGVGTMGKGAVRFVDFLASAGQKWWQVLPLGPTGYGNSPYQSFSAFAGNPYLIDLPALAEEGWLPMEAALPAPPENGRRVDYEGLKDRWMRPFQAMQDAFYRNLPGDFETFCAENAFWIEDYALFAALKGAYPGIPWNEWPEAVRLREPHAMAWAIEDLREGVAFHKMVQYLFFHQWEKLLRYASGRGVKLLGDLPFYVAYDSADVWSHPGWFQLDEALLPAAVAGVPPDPYAENGQVWGTPLFHWARMAKDGYAFWRARLEMGERLFHAIRVDHFRGFDSYFAVPYGDETAQRGTWKAGPGMAFFDALGETHIRRLVAEDLGILTPSAHALLQQTGIPGMKVLQFAFEGGRSGSPYLPHNHIPNCVVYTGTHDNDTTLGWFRAAGEAEKAFAREYLRLHDGEWENWSLMKTAWSSVAQLAIVPMQDVLSLGSEARMNTPGTVGPENWSWRATWEDFSDGLADALRHQMEVYGRTYRI